MCYLQETYFKRNVKDRLKVKECKKMYHVINQKLAGVEFWYQVKQASEQRRLPETERNIT